MYSRESFDLTIPELSRRISPYRAGYLAEDRRRIERGLMTASFSAFAPQMRLNWESTSAIWTQQF